MKYLAIITLGITAACGGKNKKVEEPTQHPPHKGEVNNEKAGVESSGKWINATPPPVQELTFPQSETFRAKQPEGGSPRSFGLPGIRQGKLKNGIQVYLVEDHSLPTVTATLGFDGGNLSDAKGKEGQSGVCMDLLTEGSKTLDKTKLEEAKADIGSGIYSFSGSDAHGLQLRALSKNLKPTVALVGDILANPGLRETDFMRIKNREIQSLTQSKSDPSAASSRVAKVVLHGAKSPQGRLKTEASLGSLTVDDCKAYVAKNVKPSGAKLFIVGDITMDEVKANFGSLQGWSGKAPRAVRIKKQKGMKGRLFVVNKKGAAQSAIRIFHYGPSRKASDYFDTFIMSGGLGRGFASRINMNLREDKGYAYGARGSFSYNNSFGVFNAGSSVRTDSTYQALKEIFYEIEAFKSRKKPMTSDELEREKKGAILALPASFATARDALGQYQSLVYYGLPLSYYNSYVNRIKKVTLKSARRSSRHVNPSIAKVVVVGDMEAPVIHRNDGKDVPLLDKAGKPMSMRQALTQFAAERKLGSIVELDEDGNVKK